MGARVSSGGLESLGGLIQNIALLIVFPFVMGQFFRFFFLKKQMLFAKNLMGWVSQVVVLFIVFNTFADSFINGVWSSQSLFLTVGVLGGVVLFSLGVLLIIIVGFRLMRLRPEESSAMCFLTSHKTLATGVPMAKLIFLGRSDLALILLPLMFYHPLQLILSGLLVTRFKIAAEKLK